MFGVNLLAPQRRFRLQSFDDGLATVSQEKM